ncbi:MAG: hypothetical protein LUD15_08595 [Bacteroides sp.]|nr:hypothetical protein [Bacteroides sp.]
MSGDLHLANDVAVKYNTSENAKIYFSEDQARLNIESPTIRGINIQTDDASLSWNSNQIATEKQVAENYYNRQESDELLAPVKTDTGKLQSDLGDLNTDYQEFKSTTAVSLKEIIEEAAVVEERVETAEGTLAVQGEAIDSARGRIEANETAIGELTGKVSTYDTEISGLKNRVSAAETTITENEENIQSNASAIETLEEKVGSHKEKIADLRQEVDTHTVDIAKNQQDILSITDDLSKKQYFKGYFITYLEIQQLEGENGAYAWCGETGTV